MKVAFYVNLRASQNPLEVLRTVEFYNSDIKILKKMGHDVNVCVSPSDLPRDAELYYCWWWGHCTLPLLLAKINQSRVLITGAFDYSTALESRLGLSYQEKAWWKRAIIKNDLYNSSANVFVSKHEYDEVKRAFPKLQRSRYIYHSIDTDLYRPADLLDNINRYFLTISWLSKTNVSRKGVLSTIAAFGKIAGSVDDARLVIVGRHGDAIHHVRSMISEMGLDGRVDLLGSVDVTRKIKLLQNAIAYVQPTLYEAFGVAIAEALACGTSVVTSARGAVPEVAGEHGIYVDPNEIEDIAEAMLACYHNAPSNTLRGERHSRIHDLFGEEARLRRLSDVIEEICC